MQGIDAFLDTYVRIDEGTRVLLCAHRSCARTAAWLYAAIFVRGTEPVTFCFDREDAVTEMAIAESLAEMLGRPGVRRVAIIVCEPAGPSFARIFEKQSAKSRERTTTFRVSGSNSAPFQPAGQSPGPKRSRRTTGPSLAAEASFAADEMDERGLSNAEIDELLEECGFDMGDLDDSDIEEIATMTSEEIGSLTDEELAALAELEDSELLEMAAGWGEEDFRVLA